MDDRPWTGSLGIHPSFRPSSRIPRLSNQKIINMDNLAQAFQKFDIYSISSVLGVALFLTIGILIFLLIFRTEQVNTLRESLAKMQRSFNDLDEQAKLIVKTDLELNKAQEELDRRLNGLNALQKTSRLISTTLDEDEIFRRLDQPLMNELGFEKNLILMYDADKKLHCRIDSGFSKEEIIYILAQLEKDRSLGSALREGHTFSSVGSPKQRKEKIAQLFDVEHFILAPILTQEGIIGILFVGNRSSASAVTEGDEELLSILANQIGQSLENAQLFEQVYRSRQDLESKIQDRTKELASALEEVNKISKMKTDFISAVSHELRTPLTSIKGYASLLMTGKIGDVSPDVKDRIAKINKHSDSLVKLINDLLDISRIESGRVEMLFTPANVTALIDNVRDLLTPQMKDKSINFVTQIAPGVPSISVDKAQFERVFINLVGNAIKFTPVNGQITVSAALEQDHVLFSVADNGIGISEKDLAKLFDEFYRVENEINASVKGSGLGLSLAKNIVEAHHGKIWITSQVGKGTTFYFTVPLEHKDVPAEGPTQSTA